MSPERIQGNSYAYDSHLTLTLTLTLTPTLLEGNPYSYDSDIWALGLSIMECALGHFPYTHMSADASAQFWDIMHQIVDNPAPQLPEHCSFSIKEFVSSCIAKNPSMRPTASDLLKVEFTKSGADDNELAMWMKHNFKKKTSSGEKGYVDKEKAVLNTLKETIRDHGLG